MYISSVIVYSFNILDMSITINLPNSLSEITLREYLSWNEKMKPHETVKCFTGVDVIKFPVKDVQAMDIHIRGVLESNAASYQDIIEIDGKEFGIIPDMHKISAGAYLDTEVYGKQMALDKIMAIIYRPIERRIGDTYTLEEYNATEHLQNSEKMMERTMDIVYGAELFFCTLEKRSLNIIKSYSLREVENQIQEMKSLIGGDGIKSSMS